MLQSVPCKGIILQVPLYGIHLNHRIADRRTCCENRATIACDFIQIAALHKEVRAFLGFGLGDAAHVPHLGIEVEVLVKMALINKQTVNTQFLKVDHIVFPLRIVELIELFFDCLSGFHKLLDRELFAFVCLYVINATLNIVKLTHELLPLAFLADRDFLKLAVTDDDRIIVACGNPAAEFLAVSCFKIPIGRHKDIRTWVQPQVLRRPLPDKVVWYNKHGFLA